MSVWIRMKQTVEYVANYTKGVVGYIFNTNTLISALQSCKLKSYQSLMTLYFETAELDNNAFEKLLCEVLLWFPNLQNLILKRCDINSLRGAEKRIKDLGFVSNINLSKLDLYCNPVFFKRLIVSSECEFATEIIKENQFE